MPTFKVAHLREQGVDLIIVPVDPSFAGQSREQQDGAIRDLQMSATLAGLKGDLVPVWDGGDGRMGFVAPVPYHPYFRSITLAFVQANLNREIYWEAEPPASADKGGATSSDARPSAAAPKTASVTAAPTMKTPPRR
jgi:hypothetical protein